MLEEHLTKTIHKTSSTLRTGEVHELYEEQWIKAGRLLEELEIELSQSEHCWLLEDFFSAADIQLGVLLFHLNMMNLLEPYIKEKPNLNIFWANFKEIESVKSILFGGVLIGEETMLVEESGGGSNNKNSGNLFQLRNITN